MKAQQSSDDSRDEERDFQTPLLDSRIDQLSPSYRFKETELSDNGTSKFDGAARQSEERSMGLWESKSKFLKHTHGVPEGLATGVSAGSQSKL